MPRAAVESLRESFYQKILNFEAKTAFQELALAAEENNALRSDLDRTREFIERETKSGGVDELTEQRLQV